MTIGLSINVTFAIRCVFINYKNTKLVLKIIVFLWTFRNHKKTHAEGGRRTKCPTCGVVSSCFTVLQFFLIFFLIALLFSTSSKMCTNLPRHVKYHTLPYFCQHCLQVTWLCNIQNCNMLISVCKPEICPFRCATTSPAVWERGRRHLWMPVMQQGIPFVQYASFPWLIKCFG